MKCPKCKDKSEVLETRHVGNVIKRRRRCLSPRCEQRFTTTESALVSDVDQVDEATIRARLMARELRSTKIDDETMRAMIATDLRRAAIKRAQKQKHRDDKESWYDTTFEPAPTRLDRDALKRELGEF